MSSNSQAQSEDSKSTLRQIADLPNFMPYFTDEDGFAAVYPELFADKELGLLKVEGFGPTKLAAFRNSHLRRLMSHPALAGNTPPTMLAEQAFYSVTPEAGKEEEARRSADVLAGFLENQVFTMNSPLHQAHRSMLGRHLVVRNAEEFSPLMSDIVQTLLRDVANRGSIDFLSDFTGRLAARFWGTRLDMTEEEERRVVDLMHGILPMFNFMPSHEDLQRAGTSMQQYMTVVSDAVVRAQARGDNELINKISADFASISLEGDGRTVGVAPKHLGRLIASNLFDGFHTAGAGAANCVYRLLTNPAELERLRNDRSLVSNAAFEGLRLDPPLTLSQRFAMEDFEFESVAVPKGTQVVMLWGAGNRDPEAFPDPDAYDLNRSQRAATTFGGGVRMCLGRSIAQLLVETVIEAVTAPGVEIELTGERYALLQMSLMRQLDAMPVSIKRIV
jgi:cytochrome P450